MTRGELVLLFLSGSLASTIMLKVAQIQYLELLYMGTLSVLLWRFARNDFHFVVSRPVLRLGLGYGTFCLLAMVLSVAALRFDFYPPLGENSVLRKPVWITVAREVELIGNSVVMLYLAEMFRRAQEKCRFCMEVYFWAGMASVGFAIFSYALAMETGVSLGAYKASGLRMRGFYNEGGPFGLYLLSLLIVGLALLGAGWETRRRILVCSGLIAIALLGSRSKAAACAAIFLFLINGFVSSGLKPKLLMIAGVVLLAFISSVTLDLAQVVKAYRATAETYERQSLKHRGDPSFTYGRVAGGFIVPRMIGLHPLTGIGWGNYAELRNAPEYRGASAWTDDLSDPGLGMLGTTADFGIPLELFLFLCLTSPFLLLLSSGAPAYIRNMALVAPVVHIFGAQLNLTYPWVVSAFALGLAYFHRNNTLRNNSKVNMVMVERCSS